jgi:hypothetical protein
MRAIDRDLIRGGHYGQRPRVPHLKAEHMAAPTNAAYVKKVLANSEPSTHGTKRTIAALQHFVRYWGNNGHAERVLAKLKFRKFEKVDLLGSCGSRESRVKRSHARSLLRCHS